VELRLRADKATPYDPIARVMGGSSPRGGSDRFCQPARVRAEHQGREAEGFEAGGGRASSSRSPGLLLAATAGQGQTHGTHAEQRKRGGLRYLACRDA